MSRSILVPALTLLLLSGCDATEPVAKIEYAAVPAIVLNPDQLTVNQGDWLEIALLRPPRQKPDYVHVSYLEEETEPWIVRCDRVPDNYADCDELERAGLVIVGQETYAAIRAEFEACGSGSADTPGMRFTLVVSSCFGLIRYKIFWDEEKVDFIPNTWKEHRGSSLNIRGCGETWAAYRLYKAAQGGEVIEYPLDAMFSDTVWMNVTGC